MVLNHSLLIPKMVFILQFLIEISIKVISVLIEEELQKNFKLQIRKMLSRNI